MSSCNDVELQLICYDWKHHKKFKKKDKTSTIHGWCFNRDTKPYLIIIKEYSINMYMEFPLWINGTYYEWTDSKKKTLTKEIIEFLDMEESVKFKCADSEKMYFFKRKRKHPMVKLKFKLLDDMYEFKKALTNGYDYEMVLNNKKTVAKLPFNFWEENIDPIRKFLTDIDLEYDQWFTVLGRKVPKKRRRSRMKTEYYVDYKTIKPIPRGDTLDWHYYPLILSFDLECYSHGSAFPDAMDIGDPCFMACFVKWRYRDPLDKLEKVSVILGECDEYEGDTGKIILCQTEKEFLSKIYEVFIELDCDVITGWNIIGFDYEYLQQRTENYAYPMVVPQIGRLKHIPDDRVSLYVDKSWSSSAAKMVMVKYFEMEGRITLDMCNYAKREFMGLQSYKLGSIAQIYIGEGKYDVSPKYMFKTYKVYLEIQKIKKQIARGKLNLNKNDILEIIKNVFGDKFGKNIQKILKNKNNFTENDIVSVIEKCKFDLTKKDIRRVIENIAIFTKKNEKEMEERMIWVRRRMRKIKIYCDIDCILPLKIFNKVNGWNTVREMANCCGLNHEKIYIAGTGKRTESCLYNTMKKAGFVLDAGYSTIKKNKGAHVFVPKDNRVQKNVAYFDFMSLYPSIVIAYNICWTTIIPITDLHYYKKDQYDLFETDRRDGSQFRFAIIKTRIRKGIFPAMMKRFLDERKKVRDYMKTVKDPTLLDILNSRQLSLKINANAGYGYSCSSFSKYSLKDIGELICWLGRYNIQLTAGKLKEWKGGDIIYGDTDSFMIKFESDDKTGKNCLDGTKELLIMMNGQEEKRDKETGEILVEAKEGMFQAPMYMEFEMYLHTIFVLTKKQYFYTQYVGWGPNMGEVEKDKEGNVIIHMKGVAPVKMENCQMISKLYYKQAEIILEQATFEKCLLLFFKTLRLFLKRKIPIEDLIMKNKMGGNYDTEVPLKVFSERLTEKGIFVETGDILNYIIRYVEGATKKGPKMYLMEEYEEDMKNGKEVVIDNFFYIRAMGAKSGVLLGKAFDSEEKLKWGENFNRKTYSLEKIGQYIFDCLSFRKKGESIGEFLTKVYFRIIKKYNKLVINSSSEIKIVNIR